MRLWTAQYRYSGKDRLDITVKGNDPIGKAFAPSWDMVTRYKNGKITEKQYIEEYKIRMIKSCANNHEAWDWLLSQDEVTLVCFCKAGAFCHRKLLAKMLIQLGAIFMGEKSITKREEV